MPSAPPPAPTVLVVDDEPAVRLLVERVLVDAGYRVLTAMGGVEALEQFVVEPRGRPSTLLDRPIVSCGNRPGGLSLGVGFRVPVPRHAPAD